MCYNCEYQPPLPPSEGHWTEDEDEDEEEEEEETKTNFAVEVLRRLPYLNSNCNLHVHYKSGLVDYSGYSAEEFREVGMRVQQLGDSFYNEEEENDYVGLPHIICISRGEEPGGRQMFLDVMHGTIYEDTIHTYLLDRKDVRSYFEDLKEEYHSLRLVPCIGRFSIERNTEERTSEISERKF